MASFTKRRNGDGSTSWDAMVRVVGYPATSKSFRTKVAAEVWAANTEARAKRGTLVCAGDMTLSQLIDDALPGLKNPIGAAFAYWRENLGEMRLGKLEHASELIAMHRDRLLGAQCWGYGHKTTKPRSAATVRNYLIELGRLFSVAVREMRVMETNPCATVKKPEVCNQIVRYLSEKEWAALADACKQSDSPDLYLFVLIALTTGARKSEIAGLLWANCDLTRRWAIFPKTKNGEARGVPLTEAVCKLLNARKRDHARVFPVDITRAWHTAIKRSGITYFRFHDLRHSCASALVQSGANLAEVAALLGHKTPQMTMRYAHMSNAATSRLVDRVMGGVS
jgi:integrase